MLLQELRMTEPMVRATATSAPPRQADTLSI